MSATQDTAGPDVQIVERYADDDEQATMYAVVVDGDPVDEFITREEADTTAHAIQFVAGLRALADFIESQPALPIPDVYASKHIISREKFAAVAQILEGDLDIGTGRSEFVSVNRGFGAVRLWYQARREEVCTPRIEDGKVVWELPTDDSTDQAA